MERAPRSFVLPPAAPPGSRVSVVAPAGPVKLEVLQRGCEQLRAWYAPCSKRCGACRATTRGASVRTAVHLLSKSGTAVSLLQSSAHWAVWGGGRNLEPVVHQQVQLQDGYLAGTDEERARALVEAFRDPTTHAVLCAKGGCAAHTPFAHGAAPDSHADLHPHTLPALESGRHPSTFVNGAASTGLALAAGR